MKSRIMNKTLILFKIVPLPFNTLIPMSFSLVRAPMKVLLKLHCCISFIKSYPLDKFFFIGNKKKNHIAQGLVHMEGAALA